MERFQNVPAVLERSGGFKTPRRFQNIPAVLERSGGFRTFRRFQNILSIPCHVTRTTTTPSDARFPYPSNLTAAGQVGVITHAVRLRLFVNGLISIIV